MARLSIISMTITSSDTEVSRTDASRELEIRIVQTAVLPVMAGPVPAIHVDPRDKPGDDGKGVLQSKRIAL
jgi:hypothetical protein